MAAADPQALTEAIAGALDEQAGAGAYSGVTITDMVLPSVQTGTLGDLGLIPTAPPTTTTTTSTPSPTRPRNRDIVTEPPLETRSGPIGAGALLGIGAAVGMALALGCGYGAWSLISNRQKSKVASGDGKDKIAQAPRPGGDGSNGAGSAASPDQLRPVPVLVDGIGSSPLEVREASEASTPQNADRLEVTWNPHQAPEGPNAADIDLRNVAGQVVPAPPVPPWLMDVPPPTEADAEFWRWAQEASVSVEESRRAKLLTTPMSQPLHTLSRSGAQAVAAAGKRAAQTRAEHRKGLSPARPHYVRATPPWAHPPPETNPHRLALPGQMPE